MECDLVNEHINAIWTGPAKSGQNFMVNGELWPIDPSP
jgi:hypothetical protein